MIYIRMNNKFHDIAIDNFKQLSKINDYIKKILDLNLYIMTNETDQLLSNGVLPQNIFDIDTKSIILKGDDKYEKAINIILKIGQQANQ
jgi:hypothetical protein